ncbi:MAG: hypothetical protein ACK4RS_00180 [Thiothrix sp.]
MSKAPQTSSIVGLLGNTLIVIGAVSAAAMLFTGFKLEVLKIPEYPQLSLVASVAAIVIGFLIKKSELLSTILAGLLLLTLLIGGVMKIELDNGLKFVGAIFSAASKVDVDFDIDVPGVGNQSSGTCRKERELTPEENSWCLNTPESKKSAAAKRNCAEGWVFKCN